MLLPYNIPFKCYLCSTHFTTSNTSLVSLLNMKWKKKSSYFHGQSNKHVNYELYDTSIRNILIRFNVLKKKKNNIIPTNAFKSIFEKKKYLILLHLSVFVRYGSVIKFVQLIYIITYTFSSVAVFFFLQNHNNSERDRQGKKRCF